MSRNKRGDSRFTPIDTSSLAMSACRVMRMKMRKYSVEELWTTFMLSWSRRFAEETDDGTDHEL